MTSEDRVAFRAEKTSAPLSHSDGQEDRIDNKICSFTAVRTGNKRREWERLHTGGSSRNRSRLEPLQPGRRSASCENSDVDNEIKRKQPPPSLQRRKGDNMREELVRLYAPASFNLLQRAVPIGNNGNAHARCKVANSPLDPLRRLQDQHARLAQQGSALTRKLEATIDRMSEELPVAFLLKHNHIKLAERVILHNMCHALQQHYTRILRVVILHWKRRTTTMQVLEQHARHVRLTQQLNLAHACAIVQRKLYVRINACFQHWFRQMLILRAIEHNRNARIIQKYWRKHSILMKFKELARCYRLYVRNRGAIYIQKTIRGFLARCHFQRLVVERQWREAAVCIQNCFRNHCLRKIARKQKQRDALMLIQRCWRGHRGRQRAQHRRASCLQAVETIYTFIWQPLAMIHVQLLWAQARKVQQWFRVVRFRCQMNEGIRKFHIRRCYLSAWQIQRAWRMYHHHQMIMLLVGIIDEIVQQNEHAAIVIQRKYRNFSKLKKHKAACCIKKILYRFHAKKTVMHMIIQWLDEWSTKNLVTWIGCIAVSSLWRASLLERQQELLQLVMEQRSPMQRLSILKGLRLITSCKHLQQEFILAHVQQIQRNWRWYHFQCIIRVHIQAILLLQRALPLLLKLYKHRRRRRIVLGRWKRRKFLLVKDMFARWKHEHMLVIQERELSKANDNIRKARWFRHQKLRKLMINQWCLYVQQQRLNADRWTKAIRMSEFHLKRHVWGIWARQQLPILTVNNILIKLELLLSCWEALKANQMRQHKIKAAIRRKNHQLKMMSFAVWQFDLQDHKRSLEDAMLYDLSHTMQRTWVALVNHVKYMKKVDAFCYRLRAARGVQQWVRHVCYAHQYQEWNSRSLEFYMLLLRKRYFLLWKQYRAHQVKQRAQLHEMDLYHMAKCRRSAIRRWREEIPELKDMHCINSLAHHFRVFKLMHLVFHNGFAVFWAQTVGARRTSMAIRIQRSYRSKRARKKFFTLRIKVRYQLDTRVTMGTDIVSFTPALLLDALKNSNHMWVFALLTFPWQPLDVKTRTVFNKAATNWQFLRRQRMCFGCANATDMIDDVNAPSHQPMVDKELGVTCQQYSLVSWMGLAPDSIPCIVAFWQGIGRPTNLITGTYGASTFRAPLKRRFKTICGGDSSDAMTFRIDSLSFSVSCVMEWVEGLLNASHEATAIDLQSYIRGFLARRYVKRLRIEKKERLAMRIRQWVDQLQRKWHSKKTNRAALRIQQWNAGIQARRLFWKRLQEEMHAHRIAAQRLQKWIRAVFVLKHTRSGVRSLLATPQRYPNAPLCEVCYSDTAHISSLVLARLKCSDCQQAFCTDCFVNLHQSGKRMLHLADTIDVEGISDPDALMCTVCDVRVCSKFCATCAPSAADGDTGIFVALCTHCFERKHTDGWSKSNSGSPRRRNPWWQGKAFQSHHWVRILPPEYSHTKSQKSSMVIEKYGWMTLSAYIKCQEQMLLTEQAQKDREEKMFAIRMQHEAILRDAFDRYDTDQSGAIDKTEFKRMFKEELCQPLTDEQVNEAMAVMDKSGNGKIEFEELLAWFAEDILNSGCSLSASSKSLNLLKEALKAKRQMRRYKERLMNLLPPVPPLKVKPDNDTTATIVSKEMIKSKPKVPGFPTVDCLEVRDFASKRKVFFRFLKEICAIEWIFEDEATIPIADAMEVFEQLFLPRWNAGQLTYDYYFDDELFEFGGSVWTRRWDALTKKYLFCTKKKIIKHVAVDDVTNEGRRRNSTRKKYTSRRKSSVDRKVTRHNPQGEHVATQTIEEEIEVIEQIDPRRKQLLWEEAKQAFAKADTDASGTIDEKELYRMLLSELCEPISKSQVRQIMKQIDGDDSGKIDFDEFFLWYATDKCQDYPSTPQMDRVRALLKTKRRAKVTAVAAMNAGINGGLSIKKAVENKLRTQQLLRDSKDASPELVTLLQEGFPKLLASKALCIHGQDVAMARRWLVEKRAEEYQEQTEKAQQRAEHVAAKKQAAQIASMRRRSSLQLAQKTMKTLLLGQDKDEIHANNIQDALRNLDHEIVMVERELTET